MNTTASSREETGVVLCAGLNAHSQLQANTRTAVRAFTRLSTSPDEQHEQLRVVFAGWSTTVLSDRQRVWGLGWQKLNSLATEEPRSVFGDLEGLTGGLDHEGGLVLVIPSPNGATSTLESVQTVRSPSLGHIAMAGNERVAVTIKQAPNSGLCHVLEFENIQSFIAYYQDPAEEGSEPERHHMLPGRPDQLLANNATFLMLMEGGEVYSWGDPRYRSLGRDLREEGATPADEPGLIQALGGLKIAKIASGGWMNAALSLDGACYMWGASSEPGSEHSIKSLRATPAGEVTLVQLPDDQGELPDVLDIALGTGHAAMLIKDQAGGGRLFVLGDNINGQLGLGSEQAFFEDWTPVEDVGHVHRVVCGSRSTYVSIWGGKESESSTLNSSLSGTQTSSSPRSLTEQQSVAAGSRRLPRA